MTNQSRSASSNPVAFPTFFPAGGLLLCVPMVAMGSVCACSALPAPASRSAPAGAPPATAAPAPAPAPAPATPAPPPAAVRTPPGAGLPAPLVALLRDENGPFLANEVFSITPPESLQAIPEAVPAPEWYAITRGRFVGVVDQFALSAVAISGVAHGARKAYTTQGLALDAFNQALTWGGVTVA